MDEDLYTYNFFGKWTFIPNGPFHVASHICTFYIIVWYECFIDLIPYNIMGHGRFKFWKKNDWGYNLPSLHSDIRGTFGKGWSLIPI